MSRRVLVAGAGGAIGSILTERLLKEGADVRAAGIKPAQAWADCDLRNLDHCMKACKAPGTALRTGLEPIHRRITGELAR